MHPPLSERFVVLISGDHSNSILASCLRHNKIKYLQTTNIWPWDMAYYQNRYLGISDWMIFYNKKQRAICCCLYDSIKIWIVIVYVTRHFDEHKLWGYEDEICFTVHMKVLSCNQRCRLCLHYNWQFQFVTAYMLSGFIITTVCHTFRFHIKNTQTWNIVDNGQLTRGCLS